jgi:hypothetical protein
MPKSPKPITLEAAIHAVGAYLERIYGVTNAAAGGVVLKDGTWIEFRQLKNKSGQIWLDRLFGRISPKQITDYATPITRDVIVLRMYEGDPYPVTRETSPGIFATDTPLPTVILALVPQEEEVQAREVIIPGP